MISVFIFCIFLSSALLNAKVYKYTDSSGVTHYSDRPINSKYSLYSQGYTGYIKLNYADEIFLDPIIIRVSKRHDMEPALIKAIIKVESDFNPVAVSRAGAQGLMQLMPQTAYAMDVLDPFDPEENIRGGTKYFKGLLERFNYDIKISLAAYNAGETAVIKSGGIPKYPETREFVKKVIKYYRHYSAQMKPDDKIYQYVDDKKVLHITNTSGPLLERISQ